MRYQIKKHSVSERAEARLSSHAFISIFIFLTKIGFFRGGGVTLSNGHRIFIRDVLVSEKSLNVQHVRMRTALIRSYNR
jgi:hypothetical protein